ncbi:two-component flavin-dependent monooxygenase [Thermomonospora umbrina]|uniref:Two-component flavin-dependent monooxygenase n=1 Tax=Thermomonospora umbrina TaxID=111806 RepID=A0A3D9SKM7_9ACTN|nr:two-component flavin-dependent monooxygenase [Thermomonospora umbrina]
MAERAAAHALQAERDGRLSPQVFEAIRDAGFARHFVPARWGGAEGGFDAFLTAVAEVGREDPSAAWCAAIASALGRYAAFLPEDGQRAVWEAGPDALVVGALVPGGEATAASGGWVLRGRWPYVSGIHASDRALLAARVPAEGGGEEVRFLLVPRSSYRIEETWRTVGMRGTGSDTLVLEETFVPREHSFVNDDLLSGREPGTAPGCFTVPLRNVGGLTFAGPVLGAARGALEAWSRSAKRRRSGSGGALDLVLARSAAETDAAELLLSRVARDADRGGLQDEWDGARGQRDQAVAVDLLVGAVNRLMRTGGTGALHRDEDLQRFWRDANAGAAHAVLQWEPAARRFAAASLARSEAASPPARP